MTGSIKDLKLPCLLDFVSHFARITNCPLFHICFKGTSDSIVATTVLFGVTSTQYAHDIPFVPLFCVPSSFPAWGMSQNMTLSHR